MNKYLLILITLLAPCMLKGNYNDFYAIMETDFGSLVVGYQPTMEDMQIMHERLSYETDKTKEKILKLMLSINITKLINACETHIKSLQGTINCPQNELRFIERAKKDLIIYEKTLKHLDQYQLYLES